jgi:hypothetical protein
MSMTHATPTRDSRPPLSEIIRGFPTAINAASAIDSVNTRCNARAPKLGDSVDPTTTYSWTEIYNELLRQGFRADHGGNGPGYSR